MTHLEFAEKLAREAGKIMLDNFKFGISTEKKADGSVVTAIDKQINELVLSSVRSAYPDYGVIAEEGSNFHNEEYVWVCDPIDGTEAYCHSIPIFGFSLALVVNGIPVLGVVYEPVLDRMYTSETGKGAFMNGLQLSVNSVENIKGALVSTTSSKNGVFDFLDVYVNLRVAGSKVMGLVSTITTGGLVAAGELTALIFPFKECWDVAAIKIIIEEAGGKTSDLNGNSQRYDQPVYGFIGSNGLIHDQLVEIVNFSDRGIR